MDFKDLYQKSISKPEEFWKEISDDIFWFKKPTKILNNTKNLERLKIQKELQLGEHEKSNNKFQIIEHLRR